MSERNKIEPLFLNPILHQKMWGGTNLKEFNLLIKTNHVGEAWLASVYGQNLSRISNGKFKGETLKQVWNDDSELFDNHRPNQPFPLLVKMLDAKENLSIQVHPNDENAHKYFAEPNGKTECWYILAAKPDAVAYYGHNAQTALEMKTAIQHHQLEKILKTISVKPGDVIYVPAGTLHALGAGIVALEVEQSSDNTLRFYDFDRVDPETGKQRSLNVRDAIAVTNFPNIVPNPEMTKPINDSNNQAVTSILRSKYFTLKRINVDGNINITNHHYSINVIINGAGELSYGNQDYQIEKGNTFIMPTPIENYQFKGNLTIIQITE